MKLSEAIAKLEALKTKHGDVPLEISLPEHYVGHVESATDFKFEPEWGRYPAHVEATF